MKLPERSRTARLRIIIGHQDSFDTASDTEDHHAENVQKCRGVLIIVEAWLLPIAMGGNLIKRARIFDAKRAGHDLTLLSECVMQF